MTARENFARIMNYQKPERLPVMAVEPYETPGLNRWHSEGLPMGITPPEHMGMDMLRWAPVSLNPLPAFPQKIIAQTPEDFTEIDSMGATVRRIKSAPTMYYGYIGHPVKSDKDWEQYKKRFNAATAGRYPADIEAQITKLNASGDVVCLMLYPFFFRIGFYLLGMENFMTAFYDRAKLLHDMFGFFGNFVLETIRPLLPRVHLEYASFAEDLAYNNGPHISPKLYEKFWLPYQDPIVAELKKYKVPFINMYSAGDLRPLLPLLMEHGFNYTYPMERASGMDPNVVRRQFGRELRLMGGFPKEALIAGRAAIDHELEHLRPIIADGGYIPALDDCVPPEVSYDTYRYFIDALKNIKV